MNSIFESEIIIRPDDIDMNNHVHSSKYIDYVFSARYTQMIKDYKMSMDEFFKLGYNWVVSISYIEYKRAMKFGETAVVKTGTDNITGAQCRVNFRIENKETGKTTAEGYIIYTMISLKTGKPVRIPEEIIKVYSI